MLNLFHFSILERERERVWNFGAVGWAKGGGGGSRDRNIEEEWWQGKDGVSNAAKKAGDIGLWVYFGSGDCEV